MSKAFHECAEMKQGMMEYIGRCREMYCEQIQKFSVLAYDYLERMDNLNKREQCIATEVKQQQDLVDELKSVAIQQTAHIKAQTNLILEYQNQLGLKDVALERVSKRKDKERERIVKLFTDELPLLNETLSQSHKSVTNFFQTSQVDSQEIRDLRQINEMKSTKIKILEQELEKSLQLTKTQEESINTDKKKYGRLVDLVKDIWT